MRLQRPSWAVRVSEEERERDLYAPDRELVRFGYWLAEMCHRLAARWHR